MLKILRPVFGGDMEKTTFVEGERKILQMLSISFSTPSCPRPAQKMEWDTSKLILVDANFFEPLSVWFILISDA